MKVIKTDRSEACKRHLYLVSCFGDDPMSLTSLLHGELNFTGAEVAAAAADAAATVEAGTVQHPQMIDAPAAVVVV